MLLFADAPPLDAVAEQAKTAQASKDDAEHQESIAMKGWKLLLDVPLLVGLGQPKNSAPRNHRDGL